MCRVRFGLTGIHFDDLKPNRPREDFFQPLIAAIPPVVRNKQGNVVLDDGAFRGRLLTATAISRNNEDGITEDLGDSPSSTSRHEESYRLARNAKTKRRSVGNKRVRDSSPSPSPSSSSSSSSPSPSPSSSSASSPPLSDQDGIHKSANTKISVPGSTPRKPVNLCTTQKVNNKPSKQRNSTHPRRLNKDPSAKRVRFAMDVQEKVIPSDDASNSSRSHSSDDSYTDPPSTIEPYDAFAGYCRARGASRSHGMDGRIAGSRIRFALDEEINTDGTDGFLDSEDGSEIDVQGLPVKGHPPRTVRAAGKGRTLDQRRRQKFSAPLARSKHPSRVMDRPPLMASGLESKMNGELRLKQFHVSQEQPVLPMRSGGKLRYPKLRSGKNLPEPIFVVRPRFLSGAKEKGKTVEMLNCGEYNRDSSENGPEGTTTPPLHPPRVKRPTRNKNPHYQPPSLSDDLKTDAELDDDLGLLIREV